MHVAQRIGPGDTLTFVHEWDGLARFDRDTPAVGLPPSSPLDVSARTYVSRSPDGRGRAITTEVSTAVTGGREEALRSPFEVLDAALTDPEFAGTMVNANYGWDNPYLAYDGDVGHWYVGTCRLGPDDTWSWRLGVVDPASGDVLGLLAGRAAEATGACRPDSSPSSFAGAPGSGGLDASAEPEA